MPAPIPAFSAAWAEAFRDAVNSDAAYRDAGRRWADPVALIVRPTTELPDGAAVEVHLEGGACTAAMSVAPETVSAPFILSASIATWREIVEGRVDPIAAVTRGAVSVARGSLGTLMIHARAARSLLACAQKIDTLWPA